MKAPIALFTYSRLDHTQRTIQALLRNFGVEEHDLIVFADAARGVEKIEAVSAVNDYIHTVSGFRSVTIRRRPYNYGLSKSIIEGVSEVLMQHETIIVLEDDMVTSPFFLTYMDSALENYSSDPKVISVHGYIYPVRKTLPDAFFLRGADCWGWATWRRAWGIFNPNGNDLLNELRRRKLVNDFDFNGAFPYSNMLCSQTKGKNDSWAILWYASAFLADKLTLYPGRSLVQNIGNDSSGVHCTTSSIYDVELSQTPINIFNLDVEDSRLARSSIEEYFWSSNPSILAKIKGFFKAAQLFLCKSVKD